MTERPNIVLILADQLRADILSAYGGTICQTPNLDRLAAESVVFTRAYTPLAVCSPARASILTGQYPHKHGVVSNECRTMNGTIQDGSHLLSRRLEALGYDRWYGGKWHLGDERCLPKDVGLPGQQFPGHGGGGYHYPEYKEYIRQKGYTLRFVDGAHTVGWHSYGTLDTPDDAETSWFIADEAIRYLREGRPADRPFFLWVNFWGAPRALLRPEGVCRLVPGRDDSTLAELP